MYHRCTRQPRQAYYSLVLQSMARHIHDYVSHAKEVLRRQRLREEVRHVVRCRYEGHAKLVILHALANEEVPPIYVLGAGVELRVVGDGYGRLVIHA